ncbi:hypothetical protein CC86DRAFT_409229 [Ophiobolus disseminans]|uniref:Uncharacterized protein n=1 Tax=Ophiobolus disseminans TaxID=1469910 RepID=A0A6A6ZRR7_9PLEO|nr:hypothetical protein CC86DRAFT_409229 [Ophiobolus disseminans]
MSFNKLSNELDSNIAGFPDGDKHALSAFSQVSKYYRKIAEPYLYRHVSLGFDRDMYQVLSHKLYRDAILTLDPTTKLPSDIILRLKFLGLGSDRRPVNREVLEDLREKGRTLKYHYKGRNLECYREAMAACQNVATLVMRLSRDIEKDMKSALKSQLSGVRLVQKWNEGEQMRIWVVQLEDEKRKMTFNTERGGKKDKLHAKERLLHDGIEAQCQDELAYEEDREEWV